MAKHKSPAIKELCQILLCCDGASQGNLGAAGYGFIARNSDGECIVAVEGSLGIATNYYAEVLAIICAGEWAIHKGYTHLIFQSDSQEVIEAFKSHKIPWFAINRWNKICRSADDLSLCHSYREINFSADTLAKRGSRLDQGQQIIYNSIPPFLVQIENDNQAYYRFI
ncbi:uncharacterized protein LOC113273177 [Papaver somniferum]|uniref:uncharacterized protein LOC113273177 n=1 Tax=Papaver somniferum TaxID=3469 RepID=UPI000E6FA832|nr:uncharacterized protein LOC113273177 [Papaver somniferum]